VKKVFSPQEIAELLEVAPSTIYAELARGHLPHTRVGRKYLITKGDLRHYVGGDERLQELLAPEKDELPRMSSTVAPA
jgi:excisionase family DNA binding protein